ncbi:pyruvate kinase [Escherichia coli]
MRLIYRHRGIISSDFMSKQRRLFSVNRVYISRKLRRTKIVTTLEPATNRDNNLEKAIAAGDDVVRMNFSHGSPEITNSARIKFVNPRKTGASWLFWVTSRAQNPCIHL